MIDQLRLQIDGLDKAILFLLEYRFAVCEKIGTWKKENNIQSVQDPAREAQIIQTLSECSKYDGMVEKIWPVIMEYSRSLQK